MSLLSVAQDWDLIVMDGTIDNKKWSTAPPTKEQVPDGEICWVTFNNGTVDVRSGISAREKWGVVNAAWRPYVKPEPYKAPYQPPTGWVLCSERLPRAEDAMNGMVLLQASPTSVVYARAYPTVRSHEYRWRTMASIL